ncbi:hypothetical protein FQN57_001663 [Myotisia sp. PD_48]|nr:hypothetical protein FQN57_001663 [Myotisia sp. PD_48]
MAQVQGQVDDYFVGVKEAFQKFLDDGEELGASITVNIDGRNVLDLWGGYSDESRTKLWEKDTITNVWSTTKTVTSLAALVLIERGQLDPFAKVSSYWPEFAANGKQDIEVRHFLSHTSGVSGWEKPFVLEDMYDLPTAVAKLAAQAPWWEPGTASGYHAQNQGHLVGELVRRVTGKPLKQFVADEIAGPLGADFQIGAKEEDWGRVSHVIPPPPLTDRPKLSPDSPAFKTFTGPVADPLASHTPGWKKADMGALNGHANARSVVRMLSPISLGGEVDGVRLLSPKTIDLIFQEQSNGVDLVLGVPLRFGIGFGLTCEPTTPEVLKGRRICYWGGWGGSLIIMDLDSRMTIAYMMNKMGAGTLGSPRGWAYVEAIYASLKSASSAATANI